MNMVEVGENICEREVRTNGMGRETVHIRVQHVLKYEVRGSQRNRGGTGDEEEY